MNEPFILFPSPSQPILYFSHVLKVPGVEISHEMAGHLTEILQLLLGGFFTSQALDLVSDFALNSSIFHFTIVRWVLFSKYIKSI